MKKIIALLSLIAFVFVAKAQTPLVSQYGKTIDTVVNTGVKYLYLPTALNGRYGTVNISITYTKISGTLGGNVALEYTLDDAGTTGFYTVQQDSVLTVTDGTTITKGWRLHDVSIKRLRVRATGASTMSGQISSKVWAKN